MGEISRRPEQAYFTRKEAAAYVRLSEETIKRAVNNGPIAGQGPDADGEGRLIISRNARDE